MSPWPARPPGRHRHVEVDRAQRIRQSVGHPVAGIAPSPLQQLLDRVRSASREEHAQVELVVGKRHSIDACVDDFDSMAMLRRYTGHRGLRRPAGHRRSRGGGIALLRLRPDQQFRYVGVDISAPMPERAPLPDKRDQRRHPSPAARTSGPRSGAPSRTHTRRPPSWRTVGAAKLDSPEPRESP
jgi:hypothetical protein